MILTRNTYGINAYTQYKMKNVPCSIYTKRVDCVLIGYLWSLLDSYGRWELYKSNKCNVKICCSRRISSLWMLSTEGNKAFYRMMYSLYDPSYYAGVNCLTAAECMLVISIICNVYANVVMIGEICFVSIYFCIISYCLVNVFNYHYLYFVLVIVLFICFSLVIFLFSTLYVYC